MSIDRIEQHSEQDRGHGQLLATSLSVNAAFSGGCGLVLGVGAPALSGLLGAPAWLLAGLGVGLLAFAGFLLWALVDPSRLVAGGRVALAADLAWIAASVALLGGFPTALTPAGNTALAAVTTVVAALAASQALGLRRVHRPQAIGTSRLAFTGQRVIAVPPERAWAAVADVGDYARFTSGVAATEVLSGDGAGTMRVCTDRHGGRWTETCTLWEEGRRYRMTVNTATYPVYYRIVIHELAQTWSLEPTPGGTRLTLTFDATVKLGVIGVAAGTILGHRLRIEEILRAYERELVPTSA